MAQRERVTFNDTVEDRYKRVKKDPHPERTKKIKVDGNLFIMVEPGTDEKKAVARFVERLKESKSLSSGLGGKNKRLHSQLTGTV